LSLPFKFTAWLNPIASFVGNVTYPIMVVSLFGSLFYVWDSIGWRRSSLTVQRMLKIYSQTDSEDLETTSEQIDGEA
jgi:hypothetical protein